MDARTREEPYDLIVIGAGIGGVVALHYARKAGLRVVAFERQAMVGGLWARLPPWQDIQFGAVDWTLGDLPIAGEDQASIRANIESWVDRFGLAGDVRLSTPVTRARRIDDCWVVETPSGTHRARNLIAATGAHNRPFVPAPERDAVTLEEFHSSELRDPHQLAGRDVVVVGGGASAYDLLDLALEHQAGSVTWVYRNTRWMIPTTKPKAMSGGPRALAKAQMSGASIEQINAATQADLDGRYAKYGLEAIRPDGTFDFRRDQLIPGRHRMIARFGEIVRHRGEIVRIAGRRVALSTGASFDADVVLWGTGYELDLSFFDDPELASIRRHDALYARCGCGTRFIPKPGLFFLGSELESTGTSPLLYSLLARTVVAHLRGMATLEPVPLTQKVNHFHLAAFLAERDPESFPPGTWREHYHQLAMSHPADRPLPIPE